MNYLVTGDWQASANNLDKCQQVVDKICQLAKRYKLQMVVHLGDLKHTLNPVDQRVTNFIVQAVSRFQDNGLQLLVLLGNHDRIGVSDTSGSCFPVLKELGVHTSEEPGSYLLGGLVFQCVPFTRDMELNRKWLQEAPGGKNHVLLFHNTVHNCKLNHSYAAPEGLSLIKDLRPERFRYVFGGHIHMHQQLAKNAWYVGSPFCQDWGEVNQRKGFLIVQDGKPIRFEPSGLPGYYAPGEAGWAPPRTPEMAKSMVRIRVPAGTDVRKATSEAESQYPGARIVVAFDAATSAGVVQSTSSDEAEVTKAYLAANSLPANYTQGQLLAMLRYYLDKQGHSGATARQLTFDSAKAKNFLCFPNLDVQYRPGLTLLTGRNLDWDGCSNGSGKSSSLSAPSVALFGKTLKGQTYDAWAMRNGKGTAYVEQTFTVENLHCRVLRQRSPAKLEFWVNGKDNSSGINETQNAIEHVTGLTWELFTSGVYIGQREIVQILRGTDSDRKSLFSQVLHLERYEKACAELRKLMRNGKELDRTIQEALANTQSKARQIQRFIENLPEEDKFVAKRLTAVKLLLDNQSKKHEYMQRNLAKLKDAWNAQQKESITASQAVHEVDFQIKHWCDELDEISELKTGARCPTCKQPISGATLKRHSAEIKSNVQKLEKKHNQLASKAEEAEAEKQKAWRAYEACNDAVRDLGAEVSKLQYELTQLEKQQQESERQQQVRQGYQQQLREQDRLIDAHQDHADWLQSYMQALEFCASACSKTGIPALICSTLTPRLNAAAAEYSELLADNEIGVQFVLTESSSIDVQIENRHGGLTVADQSEGEGRMASLITALALRQVAVPCNLLILDEPGEGLDSVNAQRFGAALNGIARRFGTVMVTTHNPFILSAVEPDYHLEAVKQNRVSRLEVL